MKRLLEAIFINREKLSLRLLFWILLLSSLLTVIATSIQLYNDYRESRRSLEQSLVAVEETILPAVSVAMWKLDKEVMESVLNGLLTQSGILYTEVSDTYGNPVIQLGEQSSDNSFEQQYPIMFSPVIGPPVVIGKLKVVATFSEIYQQLLDKVIVILLTQGMKTFFMSICILILVERIVIRHLNSLADWANKVDLANPSQTFSLPQREKHQGDVIDRVNVAINTMQSNLIQAMSERERVQGLINSIINNSPSLIYAKDSQGRYIMANQEFLSMVGKSHEQVIGKSPEELFPDEQARRLSDQDSIVIALSKPVSFDEEFYSEFYVSVKFPIFDEHRKLLGTGAVSTNITDRCEKEKQIIELNENLELKVKDRTEELEISLTNLQETQEQLVESEKMSALGSLVAGVAHEINTPLGISITASSHLLELIKDFENEYNNDQLQRSSVENLISSTQNSLDILMNNLSRSVALIQNFKQVAVDQSSEMKRGFELGEYMGEITHSLTPQLKQAGHKVTIESEQIIYLNSYPGAIAQVMTNLIMNSVKHGFKGRINGLIEIKITLNEGNVCIDYRDDGIGLSSIQKEKVFEPFYTTARGSGGSGLGMSISYNLVASKLGGRIICEDSDTGAHFKITFPNAERLV